MLHQLEVTSSPTARIEIFHALADIQELQGHSESWIRYLESALAEARTANSESEERTSLLQLGRAFRHTGAPTRARDIYSQVLDSARKAGDGHHEALALNNLGRLNQASGRVDQAIANYREALAVWRKLEGKGQEIAIALENIGVAMGFMGRLDDAQTYLNQARSQQQRAGNASDPITLTEIGWIHYRQRSFQSAIDLYRQALEIYIKQDNRYGEASVLDRLGSAHRELGKFTVSKDQHLRSLRVSEELGRPVAAAHTRSNLCELAVAARSELQQGLSNCLRALETFETSEDLNAQAHVHYNLARIYRLLAQNEDAWAAINRSLSLIETVWQATANRATRAAFIATRHLYLDELVTQLMTQRDRQGHLQALQLIDNFRGRNFLELFGKQERNAGTLDRAESTRPGNSRPERTTASEQQRPSGVATPAHSDPSPVAPHIQTPRQWSLTDLQTSLAVQDAAVINYFIGTNRVYAWWITADAWGVKSLGATPVITATAEALRALLSQPLTVTTADQRALAISALSQLLLGPVRHTLTASRVLIIPDGVLSYVPFTVLENPVPRADGNELSNNRERAPLGEHNLVQTIPSIAAYMRTAGVQQAGSPFPQAFAREATIVANPVYSRSDPRLPAGDVEPLVHEDEAAPDSGWPSLPGTRREAEVIAELMGPGRSLTITGLNANRKSLLAGSLANSRILHFATHSLIDEESPNRSGVVLSQFDASGLPIDGYLYASDIRRLDLSAELVVLSACKTALGSNPRGEAVLGLAQSFLVAGAKSAIVSLWDIDDSSTSHLMELLYRSLLVESVSPTLALQQAQASLARAGVDAYKWAGFILVGDY